MDDWYVKKRGKKLCSEIMFMLRKNIKTIKYSILLLNIIVGSVQL